MDSRTLDIRRAELQRLSRDLDRAADLLRARDWLRDGLAGKVQLTVQGGEIRVQTTGPVPFTLEDAVLAERLRELVSAELVARAATLAEGV